MAYSHIFGFTPGELMIRSDGSGCLAFDEEDIDWDRAEDRRGNIVKVELPASELIAIRDFLNKQFPPS